MLQGVSPGGVIFERVHEYRLDVLIRDPSGGPNPRLVVDPVQPPFEEPAAATCPRSHSSCDTVGPRRVRRALGARDHESGAERERPIHARPLRQSPQRAALVLWHDQRSLGASEIRHAPFEHDADRFSANSFPGDLAEHREYLGPQPYLVASSYAARQATHRSAIERRGCVNG